ncbi:MAG: HAD family hydrolase [Rhodothermales bacterium]|jgi:HAD superfamily hydrolase (TIGR01484 family)
MITLFVSDIDGCLAMPYESFRMDRIQVLSERIHAPGTPAFSLCSGRAYAYVEAMTQLLGLRLPTLFESGAGMFDVTTGQSAFHPSFTSKLQRDVKDIQAYMAEVISRYPGLSMDYAKQTQGAAAGRQEFGLYDALAEIRGFVEAEFPHFNTFHTHISIDVVPTGLTKAEGIAWLADHMGIALEEVAFIGDTNGDVPALDIVGRSFAPANGQDAVKARVDHASALNDIDAVIEAFSLVS